MRVLWITACFVLLTTACKTKEGTSSESTTSAETSGNPYTLPGPYKDWQPGSQENAIMVLKMLKAWETKNLVECATYFADSVELNFDYFHKTLSKDSLAGFLENSWDGMKSVQIVMGDWESVISKDKKDQWVTVWYKQIMTYTDGKIDSMNISDDAKIENGKIIVFDEYTQRFGSPPAN